MQDTTEFKSYSHSVNSTRRCHECSEEALGRCPACHHVLCQDHFSKNQHSPCAEEQMKQAQTQVCYVCGTQAYPDQWSTSRTTHYVDPGLCKGCGRYVCDDLHTHRKVEDVIISREGLRGHRYQYINRYCDLCSPFYRVGGMKGLLRVLVGIGTVAAGIFFYIHP